MPDFTSVAIDLGIQELRSRGLLGYTLVRAQDHLANGYISQDDYDLFFDVWSTAPFRYSISESSVKESRQRLAERFSGFLLGG